MPENIRYLRVKNMARIVEVEIEPSASGGIVCIAGKNGAGKTSLLKAIVAGFGGEVPRLREGQDRGEVHLETDSLKIKLVITKKSERMKVVVKNSEEEGVASPKAVMKSLFGKRSFDLLDFLKAKPREQIEALLRVITIPASDGKIIKICKNLVRVSKDANIIDKINDAYEQVANERKFVNREVKQAKGVVGAYNELEHVDFVDLDRLYEQKVDAAKRIGLLEKIAANKEKIMELHEQLGRIALDQENIHKELGKYENFDASEIDQAIANAHKQNALAEKCNMQKNEAEKLEKLEEKASGFTSILRNIIAYKVELMENTQFPIPGLDIVQGQVYYNGLPLKAASGAEQVIVAVAIAACEIPRDGIQALFVFDPPQLDVESWGKLENFVNGKSFQLWIAKVVDNPAASKGKIILHEGKVK